MSTYFKPFNNSTFHSKCFLSIRWSTNKVAHPAKKRNMKEKTHSASLRWLIFQIIFVKHTNTIMKQNSNEIKQKKKKQQSQLRRKFQNFLEQPHIYHTEIKMDHVKIVGCVCAVCWLYVSHVLFCVCVWLSETPFDKQMIHVQFRTKHQATSASSLLTSALSTCIIATIMLIPSNFSYTILPIQNVYCCRCRWQGITIWKAKTVLTFNSTIYL